MVRFILSVLDWNYVKFDDDSYFSCFTPLLQVLLEKSIWHFDVIWLISDQFIHWDLKAVAFLVWFLEDISEVPVCRRFTE